jgi:hypothetical protein
MVSRRGSASDPKKRTPTFQFVTRKPKYTNTIPTATGMRSVTIQIHQTSP